MNSNRQRRVCGAVIARLAELVGTGLSSADAVTVGAACGGIAGRRLQSVHALIKRGHGLPAALRRACPALDPHELAILEAGERSGVLARSLELLADHLASRGAARKRITQALAYPVFLVLAACTVLVVMSIVVLPSLTSLYLSTGSELPRTTAWLLEFGRNIRTYGLAATLAVAALTIAIVLARASLTRVRRTLDRVVLALPVFGPMAEARGKADLYRLLALMLASGASLSEALALCTTTIENRVLRGRFERLRHRVRRGIPLAAALRTSGLNRAGSDAGILHTAEAGSGYPEALRRLADIAEVQAADRLALVTQAAEPAAVLFMAAVVAFGALGLYQPVLESSALLALQ